MRFSPRSAARSLLIGVVAVSGSVAVGTTATLTAEVVLNAAVTPLIVPGTGTPNPADSKNYMANAVAYYVDTSGACGAAECGEPVPIPYIAQFWPFPFEGWGGLEGAKWNVSVASGVTRLTSELVGDNNPSAEHPVTVFGYSQGATVASIVKASLADLTDEQKANLSFVLIGNPNRPDGGLFERLAILGTVPILDATFGQPTPTDTGIETHDIALTYDGVADAPSWVLNPLALVNALAGFEYVHGTYLAPDDGEPETATPYGYTPEQVQAAIRNAEASCTEATHCQQHGDTYYITLPAKTLPIMQPLLDLGAATGTSAVVIPLVDLVSPMMQTLIETGYTRTDYSKPTPFQLLPSFNPVTLVTDLANDIPEGIRAALNPGLDPLPGWTDPIESAETVDTPDDAVVGTTKKVAVTRVSTAQDAKAAVTSDEGEVPATAPQRPSLRKALGLKDHPARERANPVGGNARTTLSQDNADDAAKTKMKMKATKHTQRAKHQKQQKDRTHEKRQSKPAA
ncbi:PE-PPE domain-containing protein [Mycobacterium sp. TNTM28]|uniref:PE-PPE domain-containing protein n=1 Tax=[Mycobacterium] fortunisiensis TaxID=2600579 RepID=A0ABS6KM52_9MYCO|nr:PE-PPE domain-containing protein [[Mycobacterium] fortunisiensis]MBU9764669.1 PE-PPE domain-containing protein [[Mycobacterium] fortunisiensis]